MRLLFDKTPTQEIKSNFALFLLKKFSEISLIISTLLFNISLSKILWLLRNVTEVQDAKNDNDLCFGTIDSWLLYKLTDQHVTDVTNASRTLLMDLTTLTWIDNILETLEIPKESLPVIQPSLTNYGTN